MEREVNETASGDVRVGVRLTADEKRMLDELVWRRYPGRQRMHSAVIAQIIRETYEREAKKRG